MSKRSPAQKIGSLGQRIVQEQIERSGFWVARDQSEDYGIDIEIEFTEPELRGKIIKIQNRAHKHVKVTMGMINERLKKSFLRYVNECRVPILLIIVSTDESKSWYIWLQKWLIDTKNISNIYDESEQKTLLVGINVHSELYLALSHEIISIANWQNDTQIYIALKDLANLSLKIYDDKLSQLLFDYLDKIKNNMDDNYLDSLIENVIELGTGIWATHRGNKVSQLLFNFIRENGQQIKLYHITKLVLRGNTYSRTGINALGIMYDNYPEYTASLKLPEKFKQFDDPRLHYYCVLRERYLDSSSPSWFNEKKDLRVGKLSADFSSINTSIFDKWANRGDSAILDYVCEFES